MVSVQASRDPHIFISSYHKKKRPFYSFSILLSLFLHQILKFPLHAH